MGKSEFYSVSEDALSYHCECCPHCCYVSGRSPTADGPLSRCAEGTHVGMLRARPLPNLNFAVKMS